MTSSQKPNRTGMSGTLRVVMILAIIALLQIPMAMTWQVIKERHSEHDRAVWAVSEQWGGAQTVSGPILIVPCREIIENETGRSVLRERFATFLPAQVEMTGDISTEVRYRSIYEMLLYGTRLECQAVFDTLDYSSLNIDPETIAWDEAFLSLGISDVAGLNSRPGLEWCGEPVVLLQGAGSGSPFDRGIRAPVTIDPVSLGINGCDCSFTIDLNGSGDLSFTPLAQETRVAINSTWNTPSFSGKSPYERAVTADGFNAKWSVLGMNLPLPQSWLDGEVTTGQLHETSFGISLLMPVSGYQMTTRAVKYGFLLIVLTFVVFFLVGLRTSLRLHPIPYLLIGCALTLFYILLLALSEHMPFGPAYLLAASGIIVMATAYCAAVLRKWLRAIFVGASLVLLYSCIYILLQLEEYALLLGSLLLFAALGGVMYATRNVDWDDLIGGGSGKPIPNNVRSRY